MAVEMFLELRVQFRGDTKWHACRALVDTGCRVPLIFNIGICPKGLLTKAMRKVRVVSADGSPMVGGDSGVEVTLGIPVYALDGTCTEFLAPKNWGYQVQTTCDCILGFPLLRQYQLTIDCMTSRLYRTATYTATSTAASAPFQRSTPTRAMEFGGFLPTPTDYPAGDTQGDCFRLIPTPTCLRYPRLRLHLFPLDSVVVYRRPRLGAPAFSQPAFPTAVEYVVKNCDPHPMTTSVQEFFPRAVA